MLSTGLGAIMIFTLHEGIMISSGKSLTGITVIFMYDISVLGFSRESNHRKHGDDADQKKIDIRSFGCYLL